MKMAKTQVYLPAEDLAALHRIAKRRRQPLAGLVREAVRRVWLNEPPRGPVGLITTPLRRSSDEHDSAFDEI